jgi:phosphoglycolate phosphatase
MAEYRAHYAEHFADRTALYPQVAQLLDALQAQGVPMAILSNKREDFTRAVVDRLLPRWRFWNVRGERPGVPRKPDPTAARELTKELAMPDERCAFVGDTRIDMETATRAKMLAVGVLWGFRDRQELIASGARILLTQPLELLDLRGA